MFGKSVECLYVVWNVSGRSLEGVWKVIGNFLDEVLEVSGSIWNSTRIEFLQVLSCSATKWHNYVPVDHPPSHQAHTHRLTSIYSWIADLLSTLAWDQNGNLNFELECGPAQSYLFPNLRPPQRNKISIPSDPPYPLKWLYDTWMTILLNICYINWIYSMIPKMRMQFPTLLYLLIQA